MKMKSTNQTATLTATTSVLTSVRTVVMQFSILFSLGLVIVASGQPPVEPTAKTPSKRPARFSEIIPSRTLDESFSPDGGAAAWVLLGEEHRALLPPQTLSPLLLEHFMDVWVQDGPGRPARNLTNGASDATRWAEPLWSPDGRQLAMVSTRGGGNLTLWVWERATGKLRQVSNQGVINNTDRFREAGGRPTNVGSYLWLDNERIITSVPIEGENSPPLNFLGRALSTMTQQYEKVKNGKVAVSVSDSDKFVYEKRSIFVVNVKTGEGKRVAEGLRGPYGYQHFWVSPDRKIIVTAVPMPNRYNFLARLKMGIPHNIELRTVDGQIVKLDKPLPANVHTATLEWSPDGKELAFYANGSEPINPVLLYGTVAAEVMPENERKITSMSNPAKLYRVNVEHNTITEVPTGDIDLGQLGAPALEWTSKGELVIRAPKRMYGVPGGPPPSRNGRWANDMPERNEWWVLSRDGKSRQLSKEKLSASLQSRSDGESFMFARGGDVLSVDPSSGVVANLTEKFEPNVASVWDAGGDRLLLVASADERDLQVQSDGPIDKIVVAGTSRAKKLRYYLFDSTTGASDMLRSPSDGAAIAVVHGPSGQVLFQGSSSDGDFLWRVGARAPDERPDLLAAINTGRRNIAKAERRFIEYTSMNGEKLGMQVVLPIGYQSGRRYPVLVNVRSGVVQRDVRESPFIERGDVEAALGYISLIPSIPSAMSRGMQKEGGSGCLMASNGVMPAVEKLVEIGMADPDRLFLFGSSLGGWTALCLAGQTARFKAVVAAESHDGGFIAANRTIGSEFISRYTDNPADKVTVAQWYSSFTDVPWWRDQRQVRDSPLSYADRVQTPILLQANEMDGTFLFSEVFFNALVSMRKPAQFIRYWGEEHGVRNPSNMRDWYTRKFAWYEKWGDIARDERGNIVWDGDHVKGRNGAPPLKPEDYAQFDLFQPSPTRQQNQAAAATLNEKMPMNIGRIKKRVLESRVK